MIRLDRAAFEEVVRRALDELPEEFAERLENVSIVVEEEPDPEDLIAMGLHPQRDRDELFGLYQGTPLIDRDSGYSDLPDRVVIYRGPILRSCDSRREVLDEIRDTVIHELGHHFGLSDEEMPY
ncbi:MAG: metallopeptidase family protein [Gemmatimonadales bacterium]|jgi:predicted Zn-dependent protease with MMP-like domain